MDDTLHGSRDKRGHWRPFKRLKTPPIYWWPPQPKAILKWLFGWEGYLLPYYMVYFTIAVVMWAYLLPPIETMKSFSVGWTFYLFVFNSALVLLWVGGFHLRLYTEKKQGELFKYNAKWPSTNNPAFLFGNQNIDNIIWTFASAVPIMTAYQVVMLWAFANDYLWYVSFDDYPIYLGMLILLIPAVHAVHFYFIHRLIHAHFFYKTIHKLHHNNVNPGPWSGLAMHPVEHVLYFSSVVVYFVIPAHPIVGLTNMLFILLAPCLSHSGFDKVVVGEEKTVDTHGHFHYLHHKLFECNYGAGVIPLDTWFGTFHDGSAEAEDRMNQRFIERARRQQEKKAEGSAPVPH